jgi:type VI protein secretion system component Hcp
VLDLGDGAHLGTVVLSVVKAGTDYIQISLDSALVTSVQYLGTPSGDLGPREQVTFQGTKVTVKYLQQLGDGSFAPPLTACFDFNNQVSC